MEEIKNKVKESGLVQMDLADFKHKLRLKFINYPSIQAKEITKLLQWMKMVKRER